MERSNRPKAKIVLRNSLVVEVETLQAATGAVWRRSKISTSGCSRENRATHGVPTTNKNVLSDPESLLKLKLELAIAIDVGEHFVKATYYLEGDGPLVFSCYKKLQAAAEACQAPHFANVRAVAAVIANADRNQSAATLEQRALTCVQPLIQWFLRKFHMDLIEAVAAFKAAKVMCPVTVRWLRPTRATVEALSIFHSSTMT